MVSSFSNEARSSDRRLSDDVWAAARMAGDGISDNGMGAPETKALFRELLHWYGAPRDPGLLRDFCATLPGGRVMLHGAGTLTAALLDSLPANIQVVGIIDRMADQIGLFHGFPVVSPATAAGMAFDFVLVAHNVYEMEMRQALIEAGIAPEKIVTAHTDPGYHTVAGPLVAQLVEEACCRPVDAMVVSCCGTAIVNDHQLAAWLPPERTIQIHIGRGRNELGDGGPYPLVDLRESLEALRAAMLRVRPRVVYVRPVLYKNYLGALIKHWLPSTVVIQEFYDFSALWPDDDLVALFGLNAYSIGWLRRAELIAAQSLDMVVSKRGGDEWAAVWRHCRAAYRLIFPQMTAPPQGPPPQPIADLVYAGFLPAPSFLRTFPVGYNFLPLLEEICRDGAMTAEILNSSHIEGDGDPIFADYLNRYAAPPIVYRARMPYSSLLERLQGYRYGWLCNDQRTFHGDRRVGICNRWTGYVSAGLPVLLDRSWGYMGDLVREYGAGIVFDRLEPSAMIAAMREGDHQALQKGTTRLRSRLLADNEVALADMAALIEQGLGRGSGQ